MSFQFNKIPFHRKDIQSPYLAYFIHMRLHFAIFKRIVSVYQGQQNCCFHIGNCFSKKKHNELKYHCFCEMTLNKIQMMRDLNCTCEELKFGNSVCKLHNIIFTDAVITPFYSFWNIGFVNDNSPDFDGNDEEDSYVINPCYEIPNNNFVNESFELTDSEAQHEGHVNPDFEVIFDIGMNQDCDNESLMYESSDDEEQFLDHDILMNDNMHETLAFPMDCTSPIYHNSGFEFRIDYDYEISNQTKKGKHCTKSSSTYHNNCIPVNKTEKSNMRKVHFAQGKELARIHHLHTWTYAYNISRKSNWAEIAAAKSRFKKEIEKCSVVIEPILRKKLKYIQSNL